MLIPSFVRRHWLLVGLAVFAFVWLAARACLQSVVIDEADSYLLFGTGDWARAWASSSGNHVLNTILFRLAIGAFGLHEWTLRMPALLGAALYIGSSAYFCVSLTCRRLWQGTLLACLVFNPFVMDYLVAARGYSLAAGLLMAALALLVQNRPALASVLLGLSFCANFSFAIVDAVTMLVFVAASRTIRRTVLLRACLPGMATALALCGWTVLHFPTGELRFGSSSLLEMWQGLVAASFFELNYRCLYFIPLVLPSLAIVLASLLLAATVRNRDRSAQESLAFRLAAILAITLAIHWLAFRTLHIPLPKDRTALFLVPLFTLCLGTLTGARKGPVQATTFVLMAVAAVFFVSCLRLTYFKEWKYNADAKNLYWMVADLNRRCGVKHPFIEWHYVASLNFYRALYHNDSLPHFEGGFPPLPDDRPAYVYWYFDGVLLVKEQGLNVIYINPVSLASVALRTCQATP